MKFIKMLVLLTMCLASLTGCDWLFGRMQALNCEYEIIENDINFKNWTSQIPVENSSVDIEVPIRATNPDNDQDAVIDRMTLTLKVSNGTDTFSASGDVPEQVTVPAQGEKIFYVTSTFTGQDAVDLYNLGINALTFTVTGTLYVNVGDEEEQYEVTIYESGS